MTYVPTDDLVQPVITDLIAIANQIQGLGTIYAEEPDGLPDDNSLEIQFQQFKVSEEVNGKLSVDMSFVLFLRKRAVQNSQDNVYLRSYITPFLRAYGAWQNQNLNNDYRGITIKQGAITRDIRGDVPYKVLPMAIVVFTDYDIPTDGE